MARYSDTLRDRNSRPIAGALVSVLNYDGTAATITNDDASPLANPFSSGADGSVEFNADDGFYTLEYRYGGRLVQTDNRVPVGAPEVDPALNALSLPTGASFVGAAGPTTVQAALSARPTSAALAAPSGSSLIGFRQSGAGAADTDVEEMLRQGWVIPEMYRQTGAVDETSMFQALFASGKRRILIPEGDYTIGADLVLPAGTQIVATALSRFYAAANNLKLFKTTELTSGTRFVGGRFEGNGYTGVTAFDLTGFRNEGATLQTMSFDGLAIGIYLRSLCWDTSLRDIYAQNVGDGIVLGEGCNAVTIDHPGINIFTGVGIRIEAGTGPLPNVGNNIIGGYVQDGPVGVLDKARSTSVNGTYFEACSEADIKFDGAIMPIIQRSYHSANVGAVCVKGRSATGARIDNVTLHGSRTGGLFDFDNTNTYCRGGVARTATLNIQYGDITGLKLNASISGTAERADVGFDTTANKPYVATGPDAGSVFQRGMANGFHDIGSGLGPAINAARKEDGSYQLVAGGEAFTFSNLANDQEFTLYLKASGTPATPITVGGVAIDLTGTGPGKRKVVRATKVGADGGATYLEESGWK